MRNRRLLFESLESRTVLSTVAAELTPAAVAPDHETLVEFVLEVTDEAGQARSSFQTGQRLYLDILVEDLRADARGVFAAALDLLFDNGLVILDGEITFSSTFPNGPNASWDIPGVLDELAAMGSMDTPGPGQMLFVRIPFIAVSPGSLLFTTNPADKLPNNEILVHGWDESVPTDHVAYGSVAIEITGSPVAGTVEPPVVTLPEPPVYPADDPSGVVVPPVVTPPEAPVFPEDGPGETIAPPDDQIVPPPDEQVVSGPGAVEQETYVLDPPLWHDLRLDRFVGAFDAHILFASVSVGTLTDTSPASSDVSVIIGGSLTSSELFFSSPGSDSTLSLRHLPLVQPSADIPIGVAPARIESAVGSTRSASRPELGELLVNRLNVFESWDDGFLGRRSRIRQ